MDCLCFLPVRVEGIMARELIRVKSDSFVAVLLSCRGRKLLSRQLSRLKGRLLCLGARRQDYSAYFSALEKSVRIDFRKKKKVGRFAYAQYVPVNVAGAPRVAVTTPVISSPCPSIMNGPDSAQPATVPITVHVRVP
jgi:hypothetical protein